MNSLRVMGAVASVFGALLVNVAQGQVYPTTSTMLRFPPTYPVTDYPTQPPTPYAAQLPSQYATQPPIAHTSYPAHGQVAPPTSTYAVQQQAAYAMQPAITRAAQPPSALAPQPVPHYAAQPTNVYAPQPTMAPVAQPPTVLVPQPAPPYAAQPPNGYAPQPVNTYAAQPTVGNAMYAAQGQTPPPMNPYAPQPLSAHSTQPMMGQTAPPMSGYGQPQNVNLGSAPWQNPQPMPSPHPASAGVTNLIGPPPLHPAVFQPSPQLGPAPSLATPRNQAGPSPSDLPIYGAPTQTPAFGSPGLGSSYYAPRYGLTGDACGTYYAEGCGSCGQVNCCCSPLWFVGAYGLMLTRDKENSYHFSYDDANEADQRTDTRDADIGWASGFGVRVGRYFNCYRFALEGVYWGAFPDNSGWFMPDAGYTATTGGEVAGNLNGILNWNELDYNGATADNWVNNAVVHAVFRENEFHNVEINLLHLCGSCYHNTCTCSRFRYHWLMGMRFFKFRDQLIFGSDADDPYFTFENDELYYYIETDNNLVGFQLGAEGEFALTCRWSWNYGIKVGLYNNHISHDSVIGGNAGDAVIRNGANAGRIFDVQNSEDDLAFLGELNFGMRCCLTRCWTLFGGYRAVGVAGVALPTNQIYSDLRGIQDVEDIDSNGSLILQGGYAGLEYNF